MSEVVQKKPKYEIHPNRNKNNVDRGVAKYDKQWDTRIVNDR